MSVQDRIHNRVKGKGRGAVFIPKSFLDLGSRAAIDQALSRLTRAGIIRRLDRGIYDFPRNHPRLGRLTPPADAVARAVAGGGTIQVSRSRAANALGLSTQVPTQDVFFTDGVHRNIQIGAKKIRLRKGSHRDLIGAGTPAGVVYQALRHLGKHSVDDSVVALLRDRLSGDVKSTLQRNVCQNRHIVSDWLQPVVQQIAEPA